MGRPAGREGVCGTGGVTRRYSIKTRERVSHRVGLVFGTRFGKGVAQGGAPGGVRIWHRFGLGCGTGWNKGVAQEGAGTRVGRGGSGRAGRQWEGVVGGGVW